MVLTADVIVGSKTKDLVILEKEMQAVAGNLYVTTDDGSYGRTGMVTKMIEDLVSKRGQTVRCLCCHRTDDHDEIRLSSYQEAEHPYNRQHEPDHGRRNRYVWSLPSSGRR